MLIWGPTCRVNQPKSVHSHSSLQARGGGCKPPGHEQGRGIYFLPLNAQRTSVCGPKDRAQHWGVSVVRGGIEAQGTVTTCLGLQKRGSEPRTSSLAPQKAFQSGNEHPSQDHGCWPLSRLKPGATVGLDPHGGSGVGAWSGRAAGSGFAAARRGARPGGLIQPWCWGGGRWHCMVVVCAVDLWGPVGLRGTAGMGGLTLGMLTAPGSGGGTARVKSCPCQLIHLRCSQAGPGGSAGFGSSKWGWRRMQFWRTRFPCKTCKKKKQN